MDCDICVSEYDNNNKFHCFGCKFDCCTDCMKTYLLTKSAEPHCMKCRAIIPYDQYIKTFDKKWRLGKYKKHRENILWEKQQTLLPITVQKIGKGKEIKLLNEEKRALYMKIFELDDKIQKLNNFIHNKNEKVIKNKFKYTHKCIEKDCNGYLNDNFQCDLCDKVVCNKCFTEKLKDHECDPELVETCKLIKSEAKPCPNCAEYISKINGCDQMFCTMCGTAFSWTTGAIEQGIIHNPHAHAFFQNNPDALNNYVHNPNHCRNHIPSFIHFMKSLNYVDTSIYKKIEYIHRHMSEFRQYRRNTYIEYINNNEADENNEDIRYRFLYNEIDDKHFKSMLFARNKKVSLKKAIYEVVISTTEIVENFLWSINDVSESTKSYEQKKNEIKKIIDTLDDLRIETNKVIDNIYLEHNYSSHEVFGHSFYISRI